MSRTQVAAPAPPRVTIRQACITDRPAIRDFLGALSPRARYLRFFTGAAPAGEAMLRLLAGGADWVDALVATEDGVIIGHAMASDTAGPGGTCVAEIGVVVADDRRSRGVGSALVRLLTDRARARGATALVMEVLAENRGVLAMIAHRWPAARQQYSGPSVTIHAPLPRPLGGSPARAAAPRTIPLCGRAVCCSP